MAEDSSSQNVDPHLVAEIVSRYVAKNSVAIDQLGGLIATVHRTLSGLGTNTPASTLAPEKLAPAVPIRRSVQPDHVVCLECGYRAVTLRRHLRVVHGLRTGGLSRPLEARDGSRADGTGLFGAPLDDSQTTWARPQAARGGNTCAARPAAAGYGINPRPMPSPLAAALKRTGAAVASWTDWASAGRCASCRRGAGGDGRCE